MLLSDKSTAQFLNQNFVCAWRMVRPVPRVTIDFGNGKRLNRTLAGNTILFVARPDGMVLDAFPGVWTPAPFQGEIGQSRAFYESAVKASETDARSQVASRYYKLRMFDDRGVYRDTTMSKARVELPLLERLGMTADGNGVLAQTTSPQATDRKSDLDKLLSETKAEGGEWQKAAKLITDVSKNPGRRIPAGTPETILEKDATANLMVVRPVIQLMLNESGAGKRVQELSPVIYKEILQLAIEDPYFGLRDLQMPGTEGPGRE